MRSNSMRRLPTRMRNTTNRKKKRLKPAFLWFTSKSFKNKKMRKMKKMKKLLFNRKSIFLKIPLLLFKKRRRSKLLLRRMMFNLPKITRLK